MSINDLIYTNAHNAYEQGLKTEQQRIIKLLDQLVTEFNNKETAERLVKVAVKRIQG